MTRSDLDGLQKIFGPFSGHLNLMETENAWKNIINMKNPGALKSVVWHTYHQILVSKRFKRDPNVM